MDEERVDFGAVIPGSALVGELRVGRQMFLDVSVFRERGNPYVSIMSIGVGAGYGHKNDCLGFPVLELAC